MRFFYHQICSLLGNTAAKTGPKNTLCNLIPNEEFGLKKNKTKQIKTPFNLHFASGIFMFHALKFHLPSSSFHYTRNRWYFERKTVISVFIIKSVVRICEYFIAIL